MSSALLVIDMQNDFCLPSADLFVAGSPNAIPAVIAAVDGFRAVSVPVIWVCRHHRADGSDVDGSRRSLFASRPFLATSPGADLVDGLNRRPDEHLIVKRRWSAFFATDLDLVLRRLGVERLYLCGVQTPNCIRGTAVDAISYDYGCTVLSDATASADTRVQEANLYDMANMGIVIATVAAALAGSALPAG